MQESTAQRPAQDASAARWVFGIAAAFAVLDRVLKTVALQTHAAGNGPVNFTLFRNTGIAFSIPVPGVVFWPVACAALALLVGAGVVAERQKQWLAVSLLACILFGALSNFFDRAVYGATIDYVLIAHRSAVNIADGMIIGGLLGLWFARNR